MAVTNHWVTWRWVFKAPPISTKIPQFVPCLSAKFYPDPIIKPSLQQDKLINEWTQTFIKKKKKKQHDVSKFQQTIQKTKYGPSSSITSHYCAEIRHFSGCDKRSSIIISQFAAYGVGFSCSAMCADSLSARTRKNKSSTSAINSAFTQQQLAVAM